MKTIEELEVRLELLQKDISELKKDKSINKRFRAKEGYTYFNLSDMGDVTEYYESNNSGDYFKYNSRNYFETMEQAEVALDRQLIKNKIMNIAEELNGDETIDFSDSYQNKFYIYYNYDLKYLDQGVRCTSDYVEEICCLKSNFVMTVKERLTKKEIDLYYKRQS